MDSVASRYAIALLSVAREENLIQEYVNEATSIVEIINDNLDLLALLSSYSVSKDEKKDALKTIFDGKIKEYILNLFYILVDNKREAYLLATLNEFIRIGNKELSILKGIVYSTIPFNEKQIQGLEKKMSDILKANVILENKIDASLLGGFKVQVEDYLLDDSLAHRLSLLKENITLTKGEKENGN